MPTLDATRILNPVTALFTPKQAEELAKILNAEAQEDGEGWTYKAKHDPKGTGFSLIDIYDEDGEFVGNL